MFLSASRIEKNRAAGLGVAGRRMEAAQVAADAEDAADRKIEKIERPEMGVLARALRRYGQAARKEAA